MPPARAATPSEPSPAVSGKAGIPIAAGYGGRTFRAEGRTIFVEPKEISKADGRTNITLGFPFATLEDYVEPDTVANDLAEYLSCPKRAAAPELFEALNAFVDGDNEDTIDTRYENARQALAKAGGEA